MVGTARFELATYGTQNRRATRLRYAPTEHFATRSYAKYQAILRKNILQHSFKFIKIKRKVQNRLNYTNSSA